MYEDKVVDFLFSQAEIAERPASRDELQHAIEAEEGHVHGPDCGHDHGDKPKAKKASVRKAKAGDADPAAEAPKPAKKAKAKKPEDVPAADAPAEKPAKKAKAKKSD